MTQSLERPVGGMPVPETVALPLTRVGRPSLWSSRELIVNLTRREVSGKYKRTALGHLWSLLNPLATMLTYTLVFSVILKTSPSVGEPSGLKVYALFLMCALLPWAFFSNAVLGGMGSLIANANLVTKVYFRRDVLVSASVASLLVTFGFEMLVLVVALLAFGGMPLPFIPLAMLMMVLLAFFALGFALLLSVANVYFRDTQHFVAIVLSLWFYLTPILYPYKGPAAKTATAATSPRSAGVASELMKHHILGVKLSTIYSWNPMTRFVTVFRDLLYDNRVPALADVVFTVVATLVVLFVGQLVFARFESRLAEEL